jgi:hypothetical protein
MVFTVKDNFVTGIRWNSRGDAKCWEGNQEYEDQSRQKAGKTHGIHDVILNITYLE